MRTYPHVDGSERALRCTELMKAALEGTATPTMAWCSLPILWHPQRMLSGQAPFLDIVRVLEGLCPSHADHPMFSSAADMVAAAPPAAAPPATSAEYDAADAALQSAAAACELLDVSVGKPHSHYGGTGPVLSRNLIVRVRGRRGVPVD